MPRYTLTPDQRAVLESWLHEPQGYLDNTVNAAGVSARAALDADPALDVRAWVRQNTKGDATTQRDWDETPMVWWLFQSDGVNVTPQNRPPEAGAWVAILDRWAASIDRAFVRVPEAARNAHAQPMHTRTGPRAAIPAGTHLRHQRDLFARVRAVLA